MLLLQRQGRMGFYLSSIGEEATHIGAAHALRESDWMFPAYREAGAALYRGYSLRTFMCQLFGNAEDPVKGRQMPVHHSVRALNFVSISSPVGTQIPHAVGAAWAAKLQKKDDVAVGFFGEGATSTPIFHSSANFAAVFKTAGDLDVPQQRLGDLGAAVGADGVADVRAEGDRLRACRACWSTATTSWR